MITENVWLNGHYMPYSAANVPALSHSLAYASTIYEGIRSYDGNIFQLGAHLTRLRASAAMFSHTIDYSNDVLRDACHRMLESNGLRDGYIKIQVFYDDQDLSYVGRNCSSQVLIAAFAPPRILPSEPWCLSVPSWRRAPSQCHPYSAKTSSTYALSFLSHRARPDWSNDVLFLDTAGLVCESSGSNIFFIRDDALVTPRTTTALAGITRQFIIDELAKRTCLRVEVADIHVDEINQFDAAFLCGTAVEIKAVGRIDGATFERSATVARLADAYASAIAYKPSAVI